MARGPVIFLGPSLPVEEARLALPDATFMSPIKRGSLLPLLDDPPSAIGIVDGEFFQSFAISTQEILLHLERGVPVFGSSSMGALRAVELESYGMVGVGEVFAMFRDGRLEADDEVAMTFCPETLRPLSEPMVNFRVALAAAEQQGVLMVSECRPLLDLMKALYFPDRTVPRLFQALRERLPPERARGVTGWWRRSAPNVKADDARLLLARMRDPKPKGDTAGVDGLTRRRAPDP